MTGYEDKIDQLARALDSVDQHVRAVDATARREQRNRLNMLHLHALAAVIIGPLFALVRPESMAGVAWTIIKLIPGNPISLGVFMFTGGMILGPATWYRQLRWEKVGLWMLMIWYATISISFGSSLILWTLGLVQGAPPAFYAPMVYLHLTCVMMVHLITINRMTRLRRLSS